MSNFKCSKCGTDIIDSENGYITGCEHYPVYKKESAWEMFRRLTADYVTKFNGFLCRRFHCKTIDYAIERLQKLSEPEAIAIMQQIKKELTE
jgi:hypothetical protein